MTKIINGYAAPLSPSAKNYRLNLKYLNFGLYALLASLGVFYLVNISDLTVSGFALRDLKNQAANLASANLDYQEAVNSAQSYYSLSARTKSLNMVAIGDVEYLAMNSNVAMAKK